MVRLSLVALPNEDEMHKLVCEREILIGPRLNLKLLTDGVFEDVAVIFPSSESDRGGQNVAKMELQRGLIEDWSPLSVKSTKSLVPSETCQFLSSPFSSLTGLSFPSPLSGSSEPQFFLRSKT